MPRRASDSASTSGRLSSLYSFVNSNSRGVHVVGTVAPGSLCGSRSLRTGVLPSPAAAIPRPKARTHCGPKNWTQSRLAKAIRHLQGCLLQPLPLPGWLHSPGPIPAEPVFSSGPVRHSIIVFNQLDLFLINLGRQVAPSWSRRPPREVILELKFNCNFRVKEKSLLEEALLTSILLPGAEEYLLALGYE